MIIIIKYKHFGQGLTDRWTFSDSGSEERPWKLGG
jgi:hypothetical protein